MPPSNSPPSPSTNSPSHSLAAAATLNAGMQNHDSRRSSSTSLRNRGMEQRRRSSIRMNLNLNDPGMPSPGELQMSPGLRSVHVPSSPGHHRAPSLGELHQELENEQEAQVNRLLGMIRQQQAQIDSLRTQLPANTSSATAIDDGTPTSERSMSLSHNTATAIPSISQTAQTHAQPQTQGVPIPHRPRNSLSRQSSWRSRPNSQTSSPALRPISSAHSDANEWTLGTPASRDESAFYQAETQMLTRENQMLKHRIRELERQLGDHDPASPVTRTPSTPSGLASPPLNGMQPAVAGELPKED
ncbi:hypothetical protein K402DRAFT_388146 [Aulographum hederae CBS 113979]|uniref:Uncharacterized protein n=1 Tax=Aulographum hederae CBS 113979 TaxID=1176131 RepID=A0A6G1HGX7_9PEZI|nr:hypothetical protein K402DRAFT_388146 [Aulographum hederae CBS 113979]